MGATYQTVADEVKTDLDRIRQEASNISTAARATIDGAINSAIAVVITRTPKIQKAIEDEMKKIIKAWDATH